MQGLYASGAIVLPVLAGVLVEAVVLVVLFRRTGRGVAPRRLLPNLMAGACLIAAAGTALRGSWWGWTGALLLLGGVFHLVDMRERWTKIGHKASLNDRV